MRRHALRVSVTGILALSLSLAAVAAAPATPLGRSNATAHAKKIKLPKKTIGIMGPINAAEIIKLATDATVLGAKTLGWKTIQVDPLGDPAKMGAGMTSLVNSNVDAIVLTTIEPGTIQSGLRAAKAKGIPVIDTHTLTHSSPLFAAEYFLPPKREFNVLLARMKKEVPRGSEIGVIDLPQFLNAKLAGDNIRAAAPAAGWKIVASHDADVTNAVADVQRAVGDMIRANPNIKAIFSCCDFGPTGAVPAIRASGKSVKVYSLHGIPSVIPQVESGLAVVEVADYQRGSFVAIDQLARHFATGAKISRTIPRGQGWKMVLVDSANASRYPFPTSKVFAPFKKKWARLYVKAGS